MKAHETILITGGAGFIGSHLADSLLADGYRVTIVDNFDPYYDPSIKRDNLASALAAGAQLETVDICDSGRMQEVLQRVQPDAVVHLAARAGVRYSFQEPLRYEQVNVGGTMQILELARETGIHRCVLASSSSVYGNHAVIPFVESAQDLQPISPYGATKLAGEQICSMYGRVHDMCVTCLRFFTVYGPRQRPDMAIASFTQKILEGSPIELYAGGDSARDYTFVGDIVAGIRGALTLQQGFEIVNLGNATVIPLRELVSTLETVLHRKADVQIAPAQQGDVQRTSADISRAQRLFGYDPGTSLLKGLTKYAEWLEERTAALQEDV